MSSPESTSRRHRQTIYTFTVNSVPHRLCCECFDAEYVKRVADAPGIGTQAYGDCEMCGVTFQSSGPVTYCEYREQAEARIRELGVRS